MSDHLTVEFERVRAETRALIEKEEQLIMGQLSGSKTGLIERAPAASLEERKKSEARRKRTQEQNQTLLLETLNKYIEQLSKDVADMEARFQHRDGDAWREYLALQILSADDIPQQRDNESIDEYRARMEFLLISELLNEDGCIKVEYENHSELSEYALWAQKQHHLNMAQSYVRELEDPNTSPGRASEIFTALEETETVVFADRAAAPNSASQALIRGSADSNQDGALQDSHSSTKNTFLNLDT